jgi:hypothetical protein
MHFDVCFEHLLEVSMAPTDPHPALKALVEAFGQNSDDPSTPEPYATMSNKVVEGYCEVILSHGWMATALQTPMPEYIHRMARQVLKKHWPK